MATDVSTPGVGRTARRPLAAGLAGPACPDQGGNPGLRAIMGQVKHMADTHGCPFGGFSLPFAPPGRREKLPHLI